MTKFFGILSQNCTLIKSCLKNIETSWLGFYSDIQTVSVFAEKHNLPQVDSDQVLETYDR